jgi:putative ABC transport system substrate-binding protein
VLKAASEGEIDSALASAVEQRAGGLLVQVDPFLQGQRDQLLALTARHRLPAIYYWRDFATAGGLMSYGTSLRDALRLVGNYAGRILTGENPADLPVQQSVKVELVINLKTARALGLDVPMPLLMRIDEVIE